MVGTPHVHQKTSYLLTGLLKCGCCVLAGTMIRGYSVKFTGEMRA
jgi:hypothetical protein